MLRIVGEDNKVDLVEINEKIAELGRKLNDVTVAAYDVVLDQGPSYSTKREEAREGMMTFLQQAPDAAPLVLDLIAHAQDWPNAEKFAKRLKTMLPPPIQAEEAQEVGEQPPPPPPPAPPPPELMLKPMEMQIEELKSQTDIRKSEIQLATKRMDLEIKQIELSQAGSQQAFAAVADQLQSMQAQINELTQVGRLRGTEARLPGEAAPRDAAPERRPTDSKKKQQIGIEETNIKCQNRL